jgi:C4-type Zn-finger protein
MPLRLNSSRITKKKKVNMCISCPNCGSQLTHRSRKKGILEYVLSAIIFVHPFRCEKCDSRFFRWSLREKRGPSRPMATS